MERVMGNKFYGICGKATGFIVFVGCWIYCITTYGNLLGITLGWIPSLIAAIAATVFWPLVWIAAGVYTYLYYGEVVKWFGSINI